MAQYGTLTIVESGKKACVQEVVVFLVVFSVWGPKTMVILRFLYARIRKPIVFNRFISTPTVFQ
jgi:hypothetical protein